METVSTMELFIVLTLIILFLPILFMGSHLLGNIKEIETRRFAIGAAIVFVIILQWNIGDYFYTKEYRRHLISCEGIRATIREFNNMYSDYDFSDKADESYKSCARYGR